MLKPSFIFENKSMDSFNSQLTNAGSEVTEREIRSKTARHIGFWRACDTQRPEILWRRGKGDLRCMEIYRENGF